MKDEGLNILEGMGKYLSTNVSYCHASQTESFRRGGQEVHLV